MTLKLNMTLNREQTISLAALALLLAACAALAQYASAQQAGIVSSGLEPTKREDTPDTIRLQATIEVGLVPLQAILYRLESGTPYVFVEALTIQPAATAAGRPPEDPLLRATLSVRAFWWRSGS